MMCIKYGTLGIGFSTQTAASSFLPFRCWPRTVREWLKELSAQDRKIIGEDIKDVEFSWPIGMPLVRSLGRGVWEVRSALPGGRIARVLFCVEEDCMVLLHGFVKKTQKTPPRDIDLAIRRMKESRS